MNGSIYVEDKKETGERVSRMKHVRWACDSKGTKGGIESLEKEKEKKRNQIHVCGYIEYDTIQK